MRRPGRRGIRGFEYMATAFTENWAVTPSVRVTSISSPAANVRSWKNTPGPV